MSVTAEHVSIGPFLMDLRAARLVRGDVEVELRPQAFHVLEALVQHSGEYLSYEQMLREAWRGTIVSHHTVAVTVGEVKKVLAEYGSWITHRPKLGYRLEVPKSEELSRKGWHCLSRHTREGFERALECFEQAARENSADFRAFEGISSCYLLLGMYGMRPPREMYRGFLDAHQRAVRLGGLTPELRASHACGLHIFERKFAEAEAELLQVQKEKPALVGGHVRLTMVYATQGRLDDALEALRLSRSMDSLLPSCPAAEVFLRLCRGEIEAAVASGKEAVDLFPFMPVSRSLYAEALETAGRAGEALREFRLACMACPDVAWLRALEGACLARQGRRAEASMILLELETTRQTDYVDAYFMALLMNALGKRNEAFQELERAYEENSATLFLLDADPRMDCLRTDQRFTRLRNKLFGHLHSPAAA